MSVTTSGAFRREPIQQRTSRLLKAAIAQAHDASLPEPPQRVVELQQTLERNEYEVLVVGEAKRGKSSFINGLLGRDVLPTGVSLSTSQVFQVRKREPEAYRLRFVDGTTRPISIEELKRYGAQGDGSSGLTGGDDKTVELIEVDIPGGLLPDGVVMIDTPGLGSLYAEHAVITNRYVAQAHAVIFVMDATSPLTEDELQFLERIAGVTSSVFFVMTKIDMFREDHWSAIQRRNEELLTSRLGTRLPPPKVWPISNRRLLRAVQQADSDALAARHEAVKNETAAFLTYISAWQPCAEAVITVEALHDVGEQILSERLVEVTEEGKRRAAELLRKRQAFQLRWGPGGQQRQELLNTIGLRVAQGKRAFSDAFAHRSQIFRPLNARIDGVRSFDEANKLAAELPLAVSLACDTALTAALRGIYNDLQGAVRPLTEETLSLSVTSLNHAPELVGDFEPVQFSVLAAITHGLGESAPITRLAVPLVGLLVGVIATSAGGATIAGSIGVLASVFVQTGLSALKLREGTESQLVDARRQLSHHLDLLREEAQRHYIAPDIATGKSKVDVWFASVEQQLVARVDSSVEQRSLEAQREQEEAERLEALTEQERRERAVQITGRLSSWRRLGEEIRALRSDLEHQAPEAFREAHLPAPPAISAGN